MKHKPNLSTQKGFTLIELLVVIAIIGILASVVVAAMGRAREKAKDAATISQMSQMRAQATQYYINNNRSYGTTKNANPNVSDLCKTPNTVFSDPGMANLIDGARKTAKTLVSTVKPVVCTSDADKWIIQGTLYRKKSNGGTSFFCVDSTGYAGEPADSFVYNPGTDPSYQKFWTCAAG